MSRPKRILILISQMGQGGAERVAANLYRSLAVTHDVQLVTLYDEPVAYGMGRYVATLGVSRVSRWNIVMRPFNFWRAVYELRKLKHAQPVDVTYSFGAGIGRVSVAAGGQDRKIVAHHDMVSLPRAESLVNIVWRRPRLRRTLLRSDKSITVSDAINREVLRLTGESRSRVITMNNGHDLARIRQLSREPQTHSITAGDRYFLAMGRLVREKRFDHLLRAFSAAEMGSAVRLVICGDDPERRGPELWALAKSLGIDDRLVIHPFVENPFPLVDAARALVLSSATEGFPNVLIESMACGIPVLSTDCESGPREILDLIKSEAESVGAAEIGSGGLLVPAPRDRYGVGVDGDDSAIAALADALNLLNADDLLWCRLASGASERSEAFSIAEWVTAHERLFA